MSGLEILGVILGAFPLAISAMEHYEECKKVAGTFYKIRRAHRKDFGRVKDCQLKFRLNMKELLLPLLADDLVTKVEYEQLLASPGGPGWQEDHVEESLAERLGDCHERYLEILKEMEETMVLLCKATRVDDEQFQALLKSQNVSKASGLPFLPPIIYASYDSRDTANPSIRLSVLAEVSASRISAPSDIARARR